MTDLGAFHKLIKETNCEYLKENCNNELLANQISKLQICLLSLKCILPLSDRVEVEELTTARDALEICALSSMKLNDPVQFERFLLQLKPFYCDYKEYLSDSKAKNDIRGMYLLLLLVQDRIGDFHISIENMSKKDRTNFTINYAIEVERAMMNGNYNKVLKMHNSVIPEIKYFADQLLNSSRERIAHCISKSYEKISVESLMKIMNFKTKDEVLSFIVQMRSRHNSSMEVDKTVINHISSMGSFSLNSKYSESDDEKVCWVVENDYVFFSQTKDKSYSCISALDIVNNSIGYATELERIV